MKIRPKHRDKPGAIWSDMGRGSNWMYAGRVAMPDDLKGDHIFVVWWRETDRPKDRNPFRMASDLPEALAALIAWGVPVHVPTGLRDSDFLAAMEAAIQDVGPAMLTAMARDDPGLAADIETAHRRLAASVQLLERTGWTVALDEHAQPIDTRPAPDHAPLSNTVPLLAPFVAEDQFWVPSAGHYSALQKLVARPELFDGDRAQFPRATFDRGGAKGHVELRPISHEDQEMLPPEEYDELVAQMWAQRGELSDLDADTLDALSAAWIAKARSQDEEIRVGIDELLRLRGVTPKKSGAGRRGGYEPEQRSAQLRCLLHIHNTWVTAHATITEESKGGKRGVQLFQSPAFVMTGRTGQLRLDGTMRVEDVYVTPGRAFRPFFFGPGRQVALLSSRALQYNSRHRTVEKRLIRYLSWRWRCAATGGDLVQRSKIETLLTEAGVKILAREPARTRERLEAALDRLAEDGVIAAWQYGKGWPETDLPRQGWLEQWRHAVAIIEAPDSIKDAYRELGSADPIAKVSPRNNVGHQVRERRKHLGLSQILLADELEISQTTLSRVENGHPCSKKIEGLLTRWLEQEGE